MFDASAFFGAWAFRNTAARSLAEVCDQLTPHGIEGAAISPAEAFLQPEPMAANRSLLQQWAGWRDRAFAIFPVPVIDPTLPTWPDHLKECQDLANGRVKAFKLTPGYHGYDPGLPALHALAEILVEHAITLCWQLRMEDERSCHAIVKMPAIPLANVASFAKQHPNLKILACGPYMSELNAFTDVVNVSAEMSFVESGHLLRDALQRMGSARLLVGTHAPLFMPAVGAIKGYADEVDPATRSLICSDNFRRLFG